MYFICKYHLLNSHTILLVLFLQTKHIDPQMLPHCPYTFAQGQWKIPDLLFTFYQNIKGGGGSTFTCHWRLLERMQEFH